MAHVDKTSAHCEQQQSTGAQSQDSNHNAIVTQRQLSAEDELSNTLVST